MAPKSLLRSISLLLLLSFSPFFAKADVPYSYTFDNPNFQISRVEYDRYIRPQLRSILADFYQLLRHIHPVLRSFLPAKQVLNEIRHREVKYTNECTRQSSEQCRKILSEILKDSIQLESLIIQTGLHLSSFSLDSPLLTPEDRQLFTQEGLIDSYIILLPTLDQLSLLSFKLVTKIERTLLFYGTVEQEMPEVGTFLSPLLRPLQIYLELFILDSTPQSEREIFKSVWVNFIKKIENNVLETDNTTYLLKNLGDLNFLWNDFHVRLTKSKSTVSSKVSSLVLTIHNRWNSILRIILN